jgi:hypothetical protein
MGIFNPGVEFSQIPHEFFSQFHRNTLSNISETFSEIQFSVTYLSRVLVASPCRLSVEPVALSLAHVGPMFEPRALIPECNDPHY